MTKFLALLALLTLILVLWQLRPEPTSQRDLETPAPVPDRQVSEVSVAVSSAPPGRVSGVVSAAAPQLEKRKKLRKVERVLLY